jgi:hypothetical protein
MTVPPFFCTIPDFFMQSIGRLGLACIGRSGARNVHFVTAADLVRGDKKQHHGRYEHGTIESDQEWDPGMHA